MMDSSTEPEPVVGETEPPRVRSTRLNVQQDTLDSASVALTAPESTSIQIQYPPPVGAILKPVGFLNGQVMYMIGAPSGGDAPLPRKTSTANRKRKVEEPRDRERPHIKKPLNAFMLFMKEQRKKVVAEFNITNNATVNMILGQRWTSMTAEDQAPYFAQSHEERRLYEQQHPELASKENHSSHSSARSLPQSTKPKPVEIQTEEGGDTTEGSSTTDAAPPESSTTKSSRKNQLLRVQPYVKKPPNAFMLFVKEQRPKIVAEFNIKNNCTVNTILGKQWKSLSQEEQAPYFERAYMERRLHEQQHPDWSGRENYGKKKKRETVKAPIRFTASIAQPEEESE